MRAVVLSLGSFLIASSSAFGQDGAVVYGRACAVCHNDVKPPTLKTKTVDELMASVISGVESKTHGRMPPRAGRNLSDAEIRAAINYMKSIAR